jgi:hypothetical protein
LEGLISVTVRVREGFSFDLPSGEQVNLHRGQLLSDGHPYVLGREQLFEPAEDAAVRAPGAAVAVETATAGPGERRSVTRGSGRRSRFEEDSVDA